MAHTRLLTRKTCKGGKAKVSLKFRNKRRSKVNYYTKRDIKDAVWFVLMIVVFYLNLVVWSI